MARSRWLQIVLVALILIALGYWLFGRASTAPITDTAGNPVEGSITSLEKIELGGVEQWLVIRGHDTRNPILLFLSGGPGASELGRVRYFNEALEERFTVVVWEQRGAGKSYAARRPAEDLTVKQYVADVLELSRHLTERFDQEKVYLLGHSWGTIIGVRAVQAEPELFHAYIGAAQMVDVRETDQEIYHKLLEHAQATGNTKYAERLRDIGEPPYYGHNPVWRYKDVLARDYGVFQESHIKSLDYLKNGDLFKRMLQTEEYTPIDKVNFVRGLVTTYNAVYPQLQDFDFREDALRLEVPVYLVLGRHDSNAAPELAQAYFERLEAPHKHLTYFEDSGHDMIFQEPLKFHELMVHTVLRETQPAQEVTAY